MGAVMSEGKKMSTKDYEKALADIYVELVKFQYWVKHQGLRVIVIFEGRDAAGKGGTIKRMVEPLNPRGCNVVALPAPSDRERNPVVFPALCEAFSSCR